MRADESCPTTRYRSALTDAAPQARGLEWPGAGHYLNFTREADVPAEIREFVAALD